MHQPSSYTPLEIANMFGVKPSTIYAWISRKEIQANRVGARRYITPQQVKDFYQKRMSGEYIDLTYSKGLRAKS
jgi:excisionase family DNA binding protein